MRCVYLIIRVNGIVRRVARRSVFVRRVLCLCVMALCAFAFRLGVARPFIQVECKREDVRIEHQTWGIETPGNRNRSECIRCGRPEQRSNYPPKFEEKFTMGLLPQSFGKKSMRKKKFYAILHKFLINFIKLLYGFQICL